MWRRCRDEVGICSRPREGGPVGYGRTRLRPDEVTAGRGRLRPDEVGVRVRSAVAVELPRLAHFLDLVEIHVAHQQLLLVRVAQVADELPAWIAEVRLPVEVV